MGIASLNHLAVRRRIRRTQ